MLSRLLVLLLGFALLPSLAAGTEAEGYYSGWPFFDYRVSPQVDYASLHLLGPLVKYETKGDESEFALRPLFYHAADQSGVSHSEWLYPLASFKRTPERSTFQLLHLLDWDFGPTESGSSNDFMAFPLVFYGTSETGNDYLAVFPFGGKILGRFWRDEIRFTLFPLYAQTVKGATTTTSWLWPIFSRTEGTDEAGYAVWPFYGNSQKTGVYRKQFCLWPIFFRQDLALDSDEPTHLRAVFPLYIAEESPNYEARTILWPFFSHRIDRRRGFEQWDFPLPLLRLTRGEDRHGYRLLPFYADESLGDSRKRWFLWPLYKVEEIHSDRLDRRRDRVLFFLYSHLEEQLQDAPQPHLRRIALWPLFAYQKRQQVSHFHLLAPLEPFFPENAAIERNWAPLWRLYQRKWDDRGNSVSTLLWNLYWQETRGEDLALEVFPLLTYSRQQEQGSELSLLKGLVKYWRQGDARRLNLFYLPWGFSWGEATPRASSPETALEP